VEQEQLSNEAQNLEDNLPMVTYIMLHRIYDALLLIAKNTDPEHTAKLVELHDQGFLMGPSPSYSAGEENE
jgi:hypothetical protein